jgi:hypothetical protein
MKWLAAVAASQKYTPNPRCSVRSVTDIIFQVWFYNSPSSGVTNLVFCTIVFILGQKVTITFLSEVNKRQCLRPQIST